MKFQMQGVPTFRFQLSLEEIEVLIRLAVRHYDMTCKRAAGPDGVIFQWRKDMQIAATVREHQDPNEEPYEPLLQADFSDLDVVAKICEPMNMMGLASFEAEVAAKVYMAFMAAMNMSNDKYRSWRCEFETNPMKEVA